VGVTHTVASVALITTATPDGVGLTRQLPRFLHAGDTVEVEIDQWAG